MSVRVLCHRVYEAHGTVNSDIQGSFFNKAQLFSREINLYGFGFEQIILRIVGFGPILNEKLFSPAVHYSPLSF